MQKKFICKIKYSDQETHTRRVEYWLVEEDQLFSFEQEDSDFICVEHPITHGFEAKPKILITEIIVLDEIDRIRPKFTEVTVAEIS